MVRSERVKAILCGVMALLMALTAALEVLAGADGALTGMTGIAALLAALNVVLRLVTGTPIVPHIDQQTNIGQQYTGPVDIAGPVAGGDIGRIDPTSKEAP